jgi:hypothetical protein
VLRGKENAGGNKQEQMKEKYVFVPGLVSDGASNSGCVLSDIDMGGEESIRNIVERSCHGRF